MKFPYFSFHYLNALQIDTLCRAVAKAFDLRNATQSFCFGFLFFQFIIMKNNNKNKNKNNTNNNNISNNCGNNSKQQQQEQQ